MLEQAKFGDYSANFDQAAEFAGMPETIAPRAIPANEDKPRPCLKNLKSHTEASR